MVALQFYTLSLSVKQQQHGSFVNSLVACMCVRDCFWVAHYVICVVRNFEALAIQDCQIRPLFTVLVQLCVYDYYRNFQLQENPRKHLHTFVILVSLFMEYIEICFMSIRVCIVHVLFGGHELHCLVCAKVLPAFYMQQLHIHLSGFTEIYIKLMSGQVSSCGDIISKCLNFWSLHRYCSW